MMIEGDGSSTVRRELVAVVPTAIKASAAPSDTLAEHEKMMAPKGTRVTAVIDSEDRGHWVIAGGVSDDAPLPEGLRFLYVGHWKLRPAVVMETLVAEEVEPIPATEIDYATPVVEPVDEPIVAPPPPAFNAPKPVMHPVAASVSPKPVNHRQLFALFKRNAKKR